MHYIEFFRQFRQRFKTTGAIAPSSQFLAKSMTWPTAQATGARRILEVGPGTGAVTNRLVRLLKPGDRLDLVEINEVFADVLRKRFENEPAWKAVSEQVEIHVMPLQEFHSDEPYDFVISGLPMNNFSPALVSELLDACFRLMKNGGVLSYFEYMYVRPMRRVISRGDERKRLTELERIVSNWQEQYRFDRDWIFLNLPPAWVQHLRKPAIESGDEKPVDEQESRTPSPTAG